MKFKHGIPQEPGYYWVKIPTRFAYDDEGVLTIQKIRIYRGQPAIGNSILEGWNVYEDALYAGPLQPPTEEE
jgi:hypothetical protein